MTLTVAPSTTHSSWVSGPILSFFRTWEGTETWPRFVTLVRMAISYKLEPYDASSSCAYHVVASQQVFTGSAAQGRCPALSAGPAAVDIRPPYRILSGSQ